MINETYIELLTNYTNDKRLTNELWKEIEQNYLDKKRYYHTLTHIDALLRELLEVKEKIESWETILFSLFYHDIIYKALKSDNEEKSAELAEKRMKQINVPVHIIETCKSQILATKTHLNNSNIDTNYFTDADLSVLGQVCEIYKIYYQNIRKEFSIYPYLIYKLGRKKVLQHFLGMERIYKTDFFYKKFETQAKLNLQNELELI